LRCLEYIKTVNHVIAQSVNYLTALYTLPYPSYLYIEAGTAHLSYAYLY